MVVWVALSMITGVASNPWAGQDFDPYHDWCENKHRYHSGNVSLKESLVGMNVSVGFIEGENNYWPYYWKILEDLSEEYGFYVRNTTFSYPDGYDYLSLVIAASEEVDIVATALYGTSARKFNGLLLPVPIFDASASLVTKTSTKTDTVIDSFFSFSDPFDGGLWGLIIGCAVFTALVVQVLSRGREKRHHKSLYRELLRRVWDGLLLFTGQGSFEVKDPLARTVVLSWSFVVLITVASYTANLAQFLLAKESTIYGVQSFDQALEDKVELCYLDWWPMASIMDNVHPNLKMQSAGNSYSVGPLIEQVRNGTCVGALHSNFDLAFGVYNSDYNPDCDLEVIDDNIYYLEASFVVNGGARLANCSSFLSQALSAFFHYRVQDGTVGDLLDDFYWDKNTARCSLDDDDDDSATELTAADMSGIFLLHAAVTLVVLVGAVTYRRPQVKKAVTNLTRSKSARAMEVALERLEERFETPEQRQAFRQAAMSELLRATLEQEGRAGQWHKSIAKPVATGWSWQGRRASPRASEQWGGGGGGGYPTGSPPAAREEATMGAPQEEGGGEEAKANGVLGDPSRRLSLSLEGFRTNGGDQKS